MEVTQILFHLNSSIELFTLTKNMNYFEIMQDVFIE